MKIFTNILLAVVVVAACFALGFMSGCQAVQGLSKDIGWTGNAVAKAMDPLVDKQVEIGKKIQEGQEKHDRDRAEATLREYCANKATSKAQAPEDANSQ